MFKVGIVGCGGIGGAHARSWSVVEGVKGNIQRDVVKQDTVVFLKTPAKQG